MKRMRAQESSAQERAPLQPVERPLPLAQRAYEELRARLLTGAGGLETRLTEDELARALRISRTPVREALHRLTLAGMIEPAAGGGYTPRRATPRDVREQCDLRLVLEPPAAALAAGREPEVRERLLREPALARLVGGARGPAAPAPAAGGVLDELAFHMAIADACGNETLAALIRAVNERFAVHRASLALEGDDGAGRRAAVAALRAGEPEAAADAMRRQLETVRATMVAGVAGAGSDAGS